MTDKGRTALLPTPARLRAALKIDPRMLIEG